MDLNKQNVVTWHDKDPEEHSDLTSTWAAKDFRTMSLSLYGTVAAPLFAAVMVKRPVVVATQQIPPTSWTGFQQAFDTMAKKGWGPYIITANGPVGSALYAAVFTPMDVIPLTRHDLTAPKFKELNDEQLEKGDILVWADAFGTPSDTHYAAIWGPNPSRQAWNCQAIDEGGAALLQRFQAMRATWCRPAHLAVTPAGRLLEMFVDSTTGPWASRAGMSSAELTEQLDTSAKAGQRPIRISASGAGSKASFAAIFADRDDVDPRTFRSNGPATVTQIDDAMQSYMDDHNLRGAAIAVTQGTRLVYAKGYTFAEADYPDVLPTTLFRQASISKTFAAVALWRLVQPHATFALSATTMQSVLQLTQPNGSEPKDARFADITLRHLLDSNSGMPQGLLYDSIEAAQAAGADLPATQAQLASYGTSFDLTGDPGSPTNVVYGNFDYFMLSQVIAKMAGQPTFEAALGELVLKPLKMTRTRGSRSLIGAQAPDEARHHLRTYRPGSSWDIYPLVLGDSDRTPARPKVAAQYGAVDYEMFDGCGGLSSAVVDVARLLAMFSDRTNNPVLDPDTIDGMFEAAAEATSNLSGPGIAHGYHGFDGASVVDATNHGYVGHKGGWLPGLMTQYYVTTGGLGIVYATNDHALLDVPKWEETVMPEIHGQTWPTDDLFPTFGMPSLSPSLVPPVATPSTVLDDLRNLDMADMMSKSMSRGLRPR